MAGWFKDVLTLGPVVAGLRPRHPSEDKGKQTGWDRARSATTSTFERPAGATGAVLAVLIGALTTPFGNLGGGFIPDPVQAGLAALLAYWLAPTVYAGIAWLRAPVKQREHARAAVQDASRDVAKVHADARAEVERHQQATAAQMEALSNRAAFAEAKWALLDARIDFAENLSHRIGILEQEFSNGFPDLRLPYVEPGLDEDAQAAVEAETRATKERLAEMVRQHAVKSQLALDELAKFIQKEGGPLGLADLASETAAIDIDDPPSNQTLLMESVSPRFRRLREACREQARWRGVPDDSEVARFLTEKGQ